MSKELEYEINNFANLLHKDCMNLMECLKKQGEDNKPILYLGKHYEKVILPYEEYQKMCNRLEAIEKGKNTDIIDNYMAFKNDNANPSEALEKLEECAYAMKDLPMSNWCDLANSEAELDEKIFTWVEEIKFELFKVKQALLNAQSTNLLMQELDCKDFADLRKYARCGYERLNSFKCSKEFKIEIPESSLMDYNPTKHYLKWEDLEFNHTPKIINVKMNGNKYKLVVGYNVAGKNLAILRDGKKECYILECDKQFFNDLHLERVEE